MRVSELDFAPARDVSLARFTSLELGGPAAWFAEVDTAETLVRALAWAEKSGLPTLILGGGSNLIIGDAGFAGLAIRLALRGLRFDEGGTVWAAAGEPWDEVVSATVRRGWAGLECLSGIPGSTGATPVQNVGAYGQEVADRLVAVEVLEVETGARRRLPAEACAFAYRDSLFKRHPGRYIVLGVEFRLEPEGRVMPRYGELRQRVGERATPAEVREAVLEIRRSKSMVIEPNDPNRRSVGSFFTNPVVSAEQAEAVVQTALARGWVETGDAVPRYPAGAKMKLSAAWLIEKSGVQRGMTRGAVGVSSRHTLALIHRGGGTTRELLALGAAVRDRVLDNFGIELVPEPVLVGAEWPSPIPGDEP